MNISINGDEVLTLEVNTLIENPTVSFNTYRQCLMAAQSLLCPATFASFLCPCLGVDGSGDGGDGGELSPDFGSGSGSGLVWSTSGPPRSAPGCRSSGHPRTGSSVSVRTLSV